MRLRSQPKGCIVNPTEPSPIGAQIDCQQRIPDAIFGALAPIFPDTVVTAGNGACTTTILAGEGAINRWCVYFPRGYCRRRRCFEGIRWFIWCSGKHDQYLNMPIEATEMEFTKILARKYELKEDITGGAGQFRGGLGIERELEMMQDDVAYTGLGDRHKFHPWGLDGGKEESVYAFYRVTPDGTITKMGTQDNQFSVKEGRYHPG